MPPDPFRAALCRQPGRDPQDWDPDADADQQTTAAVVCGACPAYDACAAKRDALGDLAAGTWAGIYQPWTDHQDPDVAAFTAIFGASFDQAPAVDTGQLSIFDMEEA